jgi:hypothetical protein
MTTIINDSHVLISSAIENQIGLILAIVVLACLVQVEIMSHSDEEWQKQYSFALAVATVPLSIVLLFAIFFIAGGMFE